MRVLLYINTLGYGGAERVMCNLANQFSSDNIDTLLVTSYPKKDEYKTHDRVNRINLEDKEEKNNFIARNIKRTIKLRKLVRRYNPDAVISFMAEPNFRAILACAGTKVPIIISIRNDPQMEYSSKVFKIAQKLLFPLASGYVFQTNNAKFFFNKKIQSKSTIIMNQVDEKFFHIIRESEEYYVAIGRLSSQKNYQMLIAGFNLFLQNNPNEILYIYGDGNDREKIQELINKYSLSKNVFLMGRSKDVPQILSRAKAFIMTSDYEGMPNAMLEAMCAGLPVIVTDCPCGGPKEIITNYKNGILIPVKDVENLANALNELNNDAILRHSLSVEAKKTSSAFKPNIVYQQWKEYLLSVIGEK